MMRYREWIIKKLFLVCLIISAGITIVIFLFMLWLGLPLIRQGSFIGLLGQPWAPGKNLYGVYPMLWGTLYISFLGLLLAFPLSLGCSAFISVIGPPSLTRAMKNLVRLMTGIPTIIYAFVGVFLLVPLIREMFAAGSGMCILSASLLLALMISPTMILFFTASFDKTPASYLRAVEALGGSKIQKLLFIILPNTKRGILAGVTLAAGRAFGDTMIALMVAGNSIQVPGSILDSARTLTSHIALVMAADYESPEFRSIFLCGLVLYVGTTIIAVIIRSIGTGERLPR